MTEHLTDPLDLSIFKMKMYEELTKHQDEKVGLRSWEINKVYDLCTNEIEERLHKIRTFGPEEIEKQCIHIANYCFFLWQKAHEVNKK